MRRNDEGVLRSHLSGPRFRKAQAVRRLDVLAETPLCGKKVPTRIAQKVAGCQLLPKCSHGGKDEAALRRYPSKDNCRRKRAVLEGDREPRLGEC